MPVFDGLRYADTYLVGIVDTLSSYKIKDGTRFIGYEAFYKCSKLTSIKIPNSVISIENSAFYGCPALASLTLGSGVEVIRSAFEDCTVLKSIKSLNPIPPMIYQSTFYGVPIEECVVEVPFESVSAYKAADYWKEFWDIQPLALTAITGTTSAPAAKSYKLYTISGSSSPKNHKGIVIKDGKKVLVK